MPQVLRVAWIADIFDEVSGIITDTEEIYQIAMKQNYFWQPVTTYTKPIYPFHVFEPVLKLSTNAYYKGTSMFVPDFLRMAQFLRNNNVNLLVSNTPGVMGLAAMACAKYLNLPWVDIYHTDIDFYAESLPNRFIKPFLNRPGLFYVKMYQKQADLIFVRTQEFYDLMIKKGHKADKLRFYPAGVNTEHWNPSYKDRSIWTKYNIPENHTITIFVGRITKVKDILYLLDAYAENAYANSTAVIVGSGPEKEEYEKKYGSLPNVVFTGVQRGEDLQRIYASADLYVLPSASETLGKTVLEAMSSGIPVLVSDKGGPRDYVSHEENGLIFKAHDQTSFREALGVLLSDRDALVRMGKAARTSVADHTDEKLFASFTGHIRELL